MPIPHKIFVVSLVLAVMPSSETHNLRGRYCTFRLKLSVTEEGLTAETGLTITIFCGIGHDELPLHR